MLKATAFAKCAQDEERDAQMHLRELLDRTLQSTSSPSVHDTVILSIVPTVPQPQQAQQAQQPQVEFVREPSKGKEEEEEQMQEVEVESEPDVQSDTDKNQKNMSKKRSAREESSESDSSGDDKEYKEDASYSDSDSGSNEEEVRDNMGYADDGFMDNLIEEPEKYPADVIDTTLKKKTRNLPKRTQKTSSRFSKEEHVDNDRSSISVLSTKQKTKYNRGELGELKSFFQELKKHGLHDAISSSLWFRKMYWNQLMAIRSQLGTSAKNVNAAQVFDTIITTSIQSNSVVTVKNGAVPVNVCCLCSLKRICSYTIYIGENDEKPIGSCCAKVARSLHKFFARLAEMREQDLRTLCGDDIFELDNLSEHVLNAHAKKTHK